LRPGQFRESGFVIGTRFVGDGRERGFRTAPLGLRSPAGHSTFGGGVALLCDSTQDSDSQQGIQDTGGQMAICPYHFAPRVPG